MSRARRLALPFLAAALAACATPAVVFVSRSYDPARVRRVALANIADFPGMQGSGEVAAGTFEKYLLWAGYGLVERRQVHEILREQSLSVSGAVDQTTLHNLGKILGVDALVFGSLTDFSNASEHTVMVDVPQEQATPIYGSVETVQREGDAVVKTRQRVVTGYTYTQADQVVPETQSLPAHVGMSVRLVDVQTGEVLWTASASSYGVDLTAAAEQASSKIMQAVLDKTQPAGK